MPAQPAGKTELDGPQQETGQEALEAGEVDQSEAGVRIDLDEQIHVARRPGRAAGRRAEQRQASDAASWDVLGVSAEQRDDPSRAASWPGDSARTRFDMASTW